MNSSNKSQWLTEQSLENTVSQSFKVVETLYEGKSPYQDIKVVLTEPLGKVLLLDDMCMISDKDEFIYHEVMAHIPLLCQEQTKRVLVIGAGDGGVIRELVRYKCIEEITLVEIDEMVTTTSREFFPNVAKGLDDPRVKIIFEDALKFIDREVLIPNNKYDLIISDSTDPVGLAENLYKSDFYQKVNSLLTDEGIFMCQTESPFYDEYDIRSIYQNLESEFKIVQPICAPILIYPGVYWTFAYCSKKWLGTDMKENKVEDYKNFSEDLMWHNLNWHSSAFNLPNFVLKKLKGSF
ncbi:polyamine aminopropyltransferase [Halobacteriovorax marinus]|nr:polyamine aminopropyltransferase [Halobacteriovorax marinus]